MTRSIEHKSFKGAFLGLISFFLNIVYSILLVPVFLSYWGDIKYGYFLAIYAFIQLMRTLDIGHQTYVGNEFSRYYYKYPKKAYQVLSSSIGIALLLGFIEFLVFIILWFTGIIDRVIDIDFHNDPHLFGGMLAMMIMWWTVGSVGGILARIILAKGLYSESVGFAILNKFIETIILLVSILFKFSLTTTFILIAAITILYSILVFYWTARKMPEYYPWWRNFNAGIGIQNFKKSVVITVSGFLDQMNNNGVLFLISKFFSAGMIPVFTTVRTLTNVMTMLTNLIVQPLVPEMIRFDSEGRKEKVWKIIEVNWLINGAIISFPFLFILPVVDQLFILWTKGSIVFNKELFYLLALSVLAINFGRAMTGYLSGINDLNRLLILSFLRFAILFGVSFLLLKSFNILAIGIGILVSEIICSVILPSLFVFQHLKNYQFEQLKLLLAATPIILLGVTLLLCYLFPSQVLWLCMIAAFLMLIIYIRLWNGIEKEIRYRLIQFIQSGFAKIKPI